jgi:hypothetical protein
MTEVMFVAWKFDEWDIANPKCRRSHINDTAIFTKVFNLI